mmetsp:Transcript_21489/g.38114  ORF Transcript_21489/g.38114 Transcript_21489/m.38114 type:complete len:244 (-) Transcript_21489:164-895(-)|eukprot:CAMPEP_0197521552 /NCGR_PEP_ID=MMETSP1318-20131121/6818_1 /TAXON_ID=552666 /ORGANISM="Partenskyella glossopodia, Strain RCC365" /LENGTH=243 /DNA_ID=CAMNT_0043073595 /DNA_START=156 /DNA_END=887 /DNA_ORIENTATION=-
MREWRLKNGDSSSEPKQEQQQQQQQQPTSKKSKKKQKRTKQRGQLLTVQEVERKANPNPDGNTTLMVSGLNFKAEEGDLREFFGQDLQTSIRNISIPLYKDGVRNRGVAFVEFDSIETMNEAIAEKNKKVLLGRYLDLKVSTAKKTTQDDSYFSKPLSEKPPQCRTVGVFNLAWKTTEKELADHFSQCGEVFSARIVRRNERPAGYGYVEFVGMKSADAAVELTGSSINGRPVRVDFAENFGE